MLQKLIAAALLSTMLAGAAMAQGGPSGGGPGPGPVPGPWIVSGASIYYNGGAVLVPSNVPGGNKGNGTINVSGGYYVNGNPIAPLAGGSNGQLLQAVTSSPPIWTANAALGVSGTPGSLTFGNATSGTVKLQTVTGALGTVIASLPANTGTIAELNLAQTWTAIQTAQGETTTSPGWYAQISGDTTPRVRVGLNATDVASIGFGAGNAVRDTFVERAGAANLRHGAPDAASPVGQTISVQNVVAGTLNTAGADLTVKGSQGTGTGVGGSIVLQVAPAGSTGSTVNALAVALTIDSTKKATFAGAAQVNGGLTVTTSFTATGLVTNADLVNASTTVNGQTCTLGSPCTVTAAAASVTVGTTTVGGSADTRILRVNGSTLGDYTISGSGTVVAMQTGASLVTPAIGVATGTSLALGGCTISTNAFCATGTAAISSTLTSAAHTITSAAASALAVGLNGATNPAFQVDDSTALQVAGVKITGAVTGGTVAIAAIDSGSNANLTLNAKGSGTIGIGSVSTGAVTITPNVTHSGTTTLSAALTYGGVTLSNSVVGTGSMVLSTNAVLVTPTLGVAIGSSLALGGATLGANALAVTGSVSFFSGNLTIDSGQVYVWASRSQMQSPSDGVIGLYNNAATAFSRLQLGGTTASFPSIKRNATAINFRLADDSADAPITAGTVNGNTITTGTAVLTGTAGKTLAWSNTITLAGTDGTVWTGPSTNATLAALNIQSQTLSGGVNVTINAIGNMGSAVTLNCGLSPLQSATNNAAVTITAPANDGSCIVRVTNSGTAGAITFSGWTVGSNTGDTYATTNTNKYDLFVRRIGGVSSYMWSAIQ